MTDAELDALVKRIAKLADDMEHHATDDWDEHEDMRAAATAITTLRAQLAAETARADRAEAALAAQIEEIGFARLLVDTGWSEHDGDNFTYRRSVTLKLLGILDKVSLRDRTALDAAMQAAKVEAWKEAAAWHEREAAGAMNSLHCGSENSEYRAANRLHDFHKASAADILALIEQEDLSEAGENSC